MQFCGFFSTFRQNDIILKAPLFSKKNFREKTITKSFFFFPKTWVTPERERISGRVSLLNALKFKCSYLDLLNCSQCQE